MRTALVAVAVVVAGCATERDDCARASAAARWPSAVRRCEAEYLASGTDDRGLLLAEAYLQVDRLDDALAVGRGLRDPLSSSYFLAKALLAEQPLLSLLYASLLIGDATARWRPAWIAQGAHLQAGAAKAIGKFALADDALVLAMALGGDPQFAQLGRVNLLRAAGDYQEARRLAQEVAARSEQTANPELAAFEHAEAMLQLGMVHVESEVYALAKVSLSRAMHEATAVDRKASAAMNLAFVESELGRCPQALAYLRLAARAEADSFDSQLLAGRIALECGDRDRAARALHAAERLPHDGQWRWQLLDLLGRLAVLDRDLALAERSYLAAIAAVEQLRRDGGLLAPIVAGKLVEPYQHAIELAARRGDWRTALGLILRYEQGADASASIDATVEAWRGRTLAILVRGDDQVWRIAVTDGQLDGAALGVVPKLGGIDLLADDPEAIAIGQQLGAAIVPDPRGRAIHVDLIGDLAAIPLAALRTATERVIARTALVRSLRITPDPRPRSQASHAVVLGDPGADLTGARLEAEAVGRALGVTPRLGADATRAALASARGAALLHVAGHATWSLDGPRLPLADAALTARELGALTPAPRLVVLASCFSARARDRGGWTSLASGFLDAGAELVISTQTSVDDAAARRLVEAFYRRGGATAPAEALRQAQLELAASGVDAHEWASFVAIAAPPPAAR